MNADQLRTHYTAEVDKTICEFAVAAAQRLLDADASVDDLPRLMRPIVQRLAEWRGDVLIKINTHTSRMRANEARIRVIEAHLERLENGATVH